MDMRTIAYTTGYRATTCFTAVINRARSVANPLFMGISIVANPSTLCRQYVSIS